MSDDKIDNLKKHNEALDKYGYGAKLDTSDLYTKMFDAAGRWMDRADKSADDAMRLHAEIERLRAENAALKADAELGRIAMRYIDRMSDPCEYVDPLEVIVRQYLAEMMPVIDRHHDAARKE